MPYLKVSLGTLESEKTAAQSAQLLTELAVNILHKDEDVIAVDVSFTPTKHWFVGGKSLAARKENSFFVEIKITEGTNTRDEKAAFVKEVFTGLSKFLHPVSAASYVVVHDVGSDAWGFSGETQEFRYIEGKLGAK